ncbi:hypothetical protein PVAP13_5KG524600, partial [Panicum virgatum]
WRPRSRATTRTEPRWCRSARTTSTRCSRTPATWRTGGWPRPTARTAAATSPASTWSGAPPPAARRPGPSPCCRSASTTAAWSSRSSGPTTRQAVRLPRRPPVHLRRHRHPRRRRQAERRVRAPGRERGGPASPRRRHAREARLPPRGAAAAGAGGDERGHGEAAPRARERLGRARALGRPAQVRLRRRVRLVRRRPEDL